MAAAAARRGAIGRAVPWRVGVVLAASLPTQRSVAALGRLRARRARA